MTPPELTVVVPAFNEAELIGDNIERLVRTLETSSRTFEVVVVDDGSTDATAGIVASLVARDPRIRLARRRFNQGKGRALERGCLAARAPVVVLLDADLEIPPDEVLPLVERLERSGADLVLGSKYAQAQDRRWPLYRRFLSRVYQAVTAVLFRLPLRDTQTGLKALRREVALELVPHVRSRRFAWDLEFVLLAHKAGRRVESVPVRLEPASRASRVGVIGAFRAAWDTVSIFVRDRGLAGYRGLRAAPPRPTTRLIVTGDDLGLSPSVNRALAEGLEQGALTGVSVLTTGAAVDDGLASLPPDVDMGVHVDLFGPRRLGAWLVATLGGLLAKDVGSRIRAQAAALRARGGDPRYADAHRHAYFLPWVRRRFLRALAHAGIPAARSLRPLGPLDSEGTVAGHLKRLVLLAAATCAAGVARRWGIHEPDGFVDAREAARWTRAGRLPGYVRGRTVEVIGHPACGTDDVPEHERGGVDRAAETRAVLDPPLAVALAALGAEVVGYADLIQRRGT